MNTGQKIKEKTYLLDPTLLSSALSLQMCPTLYRRLASLERDLRDVAYSNTANANFTSLTLDNPLVLTKLLLVHVHLNTCNECKSWQENLLSQMIRGLGGTPGITNTQPPSPR